MRAPPVLNLHSLQTPQLSGAPSFAYPGTCLPGLHKKLGDKVDKADKVFTDKGPSSFYDGEQITQRTNHQFLCALIEHNHRVTRRLELDLRYRHQILAESLQKEDLAVLESLCFEIQHEEQEKCKTRQKRKLDAVLRIVQEWKCQGACENASSHAKWVVNLSSRTLSSEEKNVLSKGLNFAPAPCKITTAQIVAAVESGLRCLPEEVAEPARNKTIGAINKA